MDTRNLTFFKILARLYSELGCSRNQVQVGMVDTSSATGPARTRAVLEASHASVKLAENSGN
jgi:hypothetical protein